MEITVAKTNCGNNIGVRSKIVQKRQELAGLGVHCRWLQQGELWGGVGWWHDCLSFQAGALQLGGQVWKGGGKRKHPEKAARHKQDTYT